MGVFVSVGVELIRRKERLIVDEIITSSNNPTIKQLKSLHKKKYQDMYSLYFCRRLKTYKGSSCHKLSYPHPGILQGLSDRRSGIGS